VNPETGDRERVVLELERRLQRAGSTEMPKGNTTLSMLLTNQKLEPDALRQLGRSVHSSMARAIQPFHTENDGDVLFCVSTEEVDNSDLSSMALALIGAELAWDGVLAAL
jgi:L-aminopeptidase/D-esterase-like protein